MERAARRTADAELRKTQERFELCMRHLPGAAVMNDREGYYRYVNNTWEKLTGLPVADVARRRDDELWPDESGSYRFNNRRVPEQNESIQLLETFPQSDGMHTYLVNKFPAVKSRQETTGNSVRSN